MRKGLLASAICCAAALWLAPTASADSVTLGAPAPDGTGPPCNTCHDLQIASDATSPSYVVPSPPSGSTWTITSWTARGGAGDGSAAIEVWRATGTTDQFRLISIGPQQPFPTGALATHSVSIPVEAGDHIGIVSGPDSDFAPLYSTSLAGDVYMGVIGNPTTGNTASPSGSDVVGNIFTGMRVNAQATLTSVAPSQPAPTTPKKKCKKKKQRSAESAKKKCKKHKKK